MMSLRVTDFENEMEKFVVSRSPFSQYIIQFAVIQNSILKTQNFILILEPFIWALLSLFHILSYNSEALSSF